MKKDLLTRPQLEIINKRGGRYPLQDAEKDYFLAVFLSVIFESQWKDALVFKGGTAMYHCYYKQVRFSKDLDFSAIKEIEPREMGDILLSSDVFSVKETVTKKYSLDIFVQYRGVLAQPDTIQLNINTNQKVLLEPKILPYKNYYGVEFTCPVMDIREIFSEKIRTINERTKPRDFYDLVILEKRFGMKVEEGIDLLRQKESRYPPDRKRIKENAGVCLERYDAEMRELCFNEVVTKEEIKNFIDKLLAALDKK